MAMPVAAPTMSPAGAEYAAGADPTTPAVRVTTASAAAAADLPAIDALNTRWSSDVDAAAMRRSCPVEQQAFHSVPGGGTEWNGYDVTDPVRPGRGFPMFKAPRRTSTVSGVVAVVAAVLVSSTVTLAASA